MALKMCTEQFIYTRMNLTQPSIAYLVTSDLLNAVKISSTDKPVNYIKKHYIRTYGKGTNIFYVHVNDARCFEKEMHEKFIEHHLHYKFFDKTYFDNYYYYLLKRTNI